MNAVIGGVAVAAATIPRMPLMPKMRPLLTADEVAMTLRVEPSTVYRWARDGVLPSVRVAGTVRFPADALPRQLERMAAVEDEQQ